ncbi:glycoside hydrolase family 31 protein [Thalassotalea agarivorans]|uniref:Oligosaccharide 4-alpha-D-glucosyltransferase n=1 Tax=Thalassotalea agarivorans TaxID=349064 RepID=A0A1I0CWY7_THASX|nr:TIM-barrel domain-containing protein [Thalassotalea agarivorans]SET23947.1 oligosaccharide 4-alpha-D-glucosyltransferase [Thalassotalea agarivorans]
MKRIVLFILLSVSFVSAGADYKSHQLKNGKLHIQTDKHEVVIAPLSSQAFEVVYLADQKQLPSFAIDPTQDFNAQASLTVEEERLLFEADDLTAVIYKSPLRISYYQQNKLLAAEEAGYFNYQTALGFRFHLTDDEKLMGTGERVVGMNRRGMRLPLYNKADYGYETESTQMNYSLPIVMSDKKYMIVFDNSAAGWVDLGYSEKNVLQFEASGGRSAYIIAAGESYPALIHEYVNITGKQPLPPRWAFGNHASRFGYKSQQQVIDTIAAYKEHKVPVDSIILDLFWFGPDIQGHMGNLDWDLNTFPAPEQMISQLQAQGVNTVLITEPFVLTSSSKWEEAKAKGVLGKNAGGKNPQTFDFYFGNTGLIDVFDDKGKAWFGDVYKRLAKQGVTGVWGDLGEPEVHPATMLHHVSDADMTVTGDAIHNAYGHQWAQVVRDALHELTPAQRQFIIMRAGFAGSQRFGLIPWTGDVNRSWGGLKPQVELSLQMSLLGLAYTHSDLGGFAGGEAFDQDLYLRWLQYGVFQPIYRPHAQDNIAPEPVFHDEETIRIARDYINLRYKLLPYVYTLAYENSTTGMPLMRPMFFENEQDSSLIDEKDQYFWGDSFLVKPVTDPKLTSIEVNLPAGKWFDYFSTRAYEGGQTIDYPLTLETMPVLVRGGAIIPSVPVVQSTQDYSSAQLQLDYYFDGSTAPHSATMYEDDGMSATSLTDKAFELLSFDAQTQGKTLSFSLNRTAQGQGYKGMPAQRSITLVVHNISAVAGVELAGEPHAFEYDETTQKLTVTFAWQHQLATVKITQK